MTPANLGQVAMSSYWQRSAWVMALFAVWDLAIPFVELGEPAEGELPPAVDGVAVREFVGADQSNI